MKVRLGRESADWEMVREKSVSRQAGWADGAPALREESMSDETGVRVLKDGGQGLATATGFGPNRLDRIVQEAEEIAKHSPKDPNRKFWDKKSRPNKIKGDGRRSVKPIEWDAILDRFDSIEKNLLKSNPRIKKVVRLQSESREVHFRLSNSYGVDFEKKKTASRFIVEILAEENGFSETAWDVAETRFYEDLKMEEWAMETARRAVQMLGGKPLSSGDYPVVVHPRVGVQFLELLCTALSAEEIFLGRSFLKGKRGERIGSEALSLVDDPFLPDGLESADLDDEGVPKNRIQMVENGRLNAFFYDLRSACREKVNPPGQGTRESVRVVPSPGPSNFFINPGPFETAALMSGESKVFYLQDVMGLHMADPMTGDFSLGAAGKLYEKGRPSHPVRGVTIAGTIESVLKEISMIGKETQWYGSFGSPHFFVSHMTVSGY